MFKKVLLLLLLLSLQCSVVVNAVSYRDAIKSSKPIVVLIYANWVENPQGVLNSFAKIEKLDSRYNYVRLNIADKDMKLFNDKYTMATRLPYILLMKNNGKIIRMINTNCMNDTSCMKEKLNFFYN